MTQPMYCKHCWIRVKRAAFDEARDKKIKDDPHTHRTVIGEYKGPFYHHESTRDDSGNPWCGKELLTEEDLEPADTVEA